MVDEGGVVKLGVETLEVVRVVISALAPVTDGGAVEVEDDVAVVKSVD